MLVIDNLRSSSDFKVREVSAYCLGRIHPRKYHAEALNALQNALTDRIPTVRIAASQAIDEFDPEYSVGALRALTAAVSAEDDPNVRVVISKTLGSIAHKTVTVVDATTRTADLNALSDSESGLTTN